MSPHRLFRIPMVRTVPLRSSRPLLHHRRHRCGLCVARFEDRTLLSGIAGDVLAAIAPKIALGIPTTGVLAPGEVVFFQIDPNTDGWLVAQVHAEGATTRLSLWDAQGQVLMQSDGHSLGNPDDQIDLHVSAGTDYLEVENLGGTGAYILTTTLTPATTPFQPIPVGSLPDSIVAGDFKGDSLTDLAVANYGANDVSILLGNGDGTFQPQATYAAGNGPTALALGDFNGDGLLDVAVADAGINGVGQGVSILLGNGDGTFQAPKFYPIAGTYPASIVAGDFTDNGVLDLAVANQFSGNVSILLGDGRGGFSGPITISLLDPGAEPISMVAGDFTGDGRLELAVLDQTNNEVSILGSDVRGEFQVLSQISLTVPQGFPIALAAGDFTGDGVDDLAVVSEGSDGSDFVSVMLGMASGTFDLLTPIFIGTGLAPTSIIAAHLLGGSPLDLAIADSGSQSSVSLLQGDGRGGFNVLPVLDLGSEGYPVAVTAGNFTGNGGSDLAVANFGSNDVSVFPTMFPVGTAPGPLFVGNFDGKLDLLTVNSGANDLTLISDFMGWSPVTSTISSGGIDPVAAFEFSSGSGFDNLVVANNGDGTFALLEGGAHGLNLTSTVTEPGLHPTDLTFLAFTGGQVQFYAATKGSEAATLLSFQLGGETGMPTVPGLQPLRDAALPLIATLLTLTIETSTAEFDLSANQRRGCRGRFVPTRKYGDYGAKPAGACEHWRECEQRPRGAEQTSRARSLCHAGILVLAAVSHGARRGPGPVLS